MTEEEAKNELTKLSEKLFFDYKYMYDYNISLVKATAGWRKEKEGLIQDLTNSKNENLKLKQKLDEASTTIVEITVASVILGILGVIACLL